MHRIWIGLFACLLSACTSTLVEYPAQTIAERDAYAVIEDVVMAQPKPLRPESLYIDRNYMGFNEPTAAGQTGTADAKGERIYFNSIDAVQLYKLRGRYTVQLFRVDGQAQRGFSMSSREQAQRFVDAIEYYRSQAPESGGFN